MAAARTWALRLAATALVLWALAWIGAYLGNRQFFNPYYFRIVLLIGLAIILAVSLNLVNGVTGQFSIGHAGFMALGGYTAAAFTVYGQHRFLPVLDHASQTTQYGVLAAALLLGGLAAAAAGFLVGLPSLRLRGDYLAIVTLGFGEIIRVAILNIEAVGGSSGFRGYTTPKGYVSIPGLTDFFWIYLVVFGVILFSRNLLRSTHGLAFFSVREDEIAAEAMGVNTTRVKVTAFVISAFFAGVAGALFAHLDSYLKPDTFNFLRSIEIVTMVVLGGMGSISGSVLGAAILTAAPEVLRVWMGELSRRHAVPANLSPDLVRQLLYAVLLIVLMLTRPQGLLGPREVSLRGLFPRRKRDIAAPLTGPG
jgi:branched-chain amino acid transport system permease protein